MAYERFEVALERDGEPPLQQRRDVLRASHVAVVLPIDLARGEVVLIRQFRLPAHLVTGRGDMVEIVAGRVEPGEAARRPRRGANASRRSASRRIGWSNCSA